MKLHIIDKPTEGTVFDWQRLPPGSMWRMPEEDKPGRECWAIVLPNNAGIWNTTDGNNMWDVGGDPPNLTVSPSILVSTRVKGVDKELWHGFITNGEMQ
jgi:hypothetical protein